jgi:23S rRNA-/tRNA-specific pseudouridylate synthase
VSSWLKFLKHHKTEAPVDFNEDLWKKFEGKTQSYRKLIITTLSIAASVLLFIAFTYSYSEKDNLSYEEKEALLKQSLELFSENEENIANQDILYEDESIIIYTKSNKN